MHLDPERYGDKAAINGLSDTALITACRYYISPLFAAFFICGRQGIIAEKYPLKLSCLCTLTEFCPFWLNLQYMRE